MKACRLFVLVLGIQACHSQPAQTVAPIQVGEVTAFKTERIDQSIAGQTRRFEYRSSANNELIQLEIERLFSSRPFLGQSYIRYTQDGRWIIGNPSDIADIIPFKSSSNSPNLVCKLPSVWLNQNILEADFSNQNTKWRIYITRIYELPKHLPGIATEAEPAVNILACKL